MTCERSEITRRDGGAVAPDGEKWLVPADEVDELAGIMMPEAITKRPVELLRAEAAALFRDGLRGPAGRSLIARDVAASRAHVRFFGVLLDHEVGRLGRGKGDLRRARVLSELVDKQHKRLVAGCEILLKLDTTPTPAFQVRADQAAILLGDMAVTRSPADSG